MSKRTVTLLALTSLLSFAATPVVKRNLSFEERVAAQRAIERVYFNHQLGGRRSFEEAVPQAIVEGKVENYLKQSAALEKFWHTRITAEMLQRESERIARGTHAADRLNELYAALGNDAFLFQETVTRAAVADRISRSFFASDPHIHGQSRNEIDSIHGRLLNGTLNPNLENARRTLLEIVEDAKDPQDTPRRTLRPNGAGGAQSLKLDVSADRFHELRLQLPARSGDIGPIREGREDFSVSVLLEEKTGSLRVASFVVPKRTWDDWWAEVTGLLDTKSVEVVAPESALLARPSASATASSFSASWSPDAMSSNYPSFVSAEVAASCAPDTWDNGSLAGVLDPTAGHHAVWTGNLMLVWGGSALNRGARYDPVIDWWTPISSTNAPSNRDSFTTVWSGSHMIVWGGKETGPAGAYLQSGARYDPVSDSWSPTSTSGAPTPRSGPVSVWTGSEMLVWGGVQPGPIPPGGLVFVRSGGRYDPASDSWLPISTINSPVNPSQTAVWGNDMLIVWGRYGGGKYDPRTDAWSSISSVGAPVASGSSAIWSGSEMIIWGGEDSNFAVINTGARYNPITDTWSPTSTVSAPPGSYFPSAVWTGNRMVVWGGSGDDGGIFVYRDTGGIYDPASDSWSATSLTGAPSGRRNHTAVWTGAQMIVWGGVNQMLTNSGGRYDPAGNSWTPTSSNGAPSPRSFHSAVWTGTEMIVWGGFLAGLSITDLNTGGRYNPILDAWTPTSTAGSPAGTSHHAAIWTGDEMIVWGGGDSLVAGRYDPAADHWSSLSLTNSPMPRFGASAVWTGNRMIVWGGVDVLGISLIYSNQGGVYDPARDRWTLTSLVNAPSPRFKHEAVWTGTEMIIWGGLTASSDFVNSGARYDPLADSWSPTSMIGAPPVLYGFQNITGPAAVWTGSRMIVSGYSFPDPIGGGLYDPTSDSWSPMSLTGALAAIRAVWTSQEMIVWGTGWYDGPAGLGARYDPAADVWAPVSTIDAPRNRRGHTAVWTGSEMIVWGGDNNDSLNSGGRYRPAAGVPTDGDGDGVAVCAGDCDDANPDVFAGHPEICDGLDNDCDKSIDEGGAGLCDDSDPCTTDSCQGASGCVHQNKTAISLNLQPSTISVANHKLVDVVATVVASFCSGAATSVVLTSVTSSEPDDAPGPADGHTINDVQGADLATADFQFQVRAEAARTGPGRTYTVVYTATDGLGNQSVATGHVFVRNHSYKQRLLNLGPDRKRELKD